MGEHDKQLVVDASAWLFNVSTSVLIVFVNKVLMGRSGYMFNFATTLCALHFLACAGSLGVMQLLGVTESRTVPWTDKLIFAAAANISIASLNLSLMINTVGFYQIAKLLIIPFTAVVEWLWLRQSMSKEQVSCTAVVLLGVAVVTVSDVSSSTLGVVIAAVSVASSAMQQILCRYYQKKHSLASHELLSSTAPLQGWSLLLVGPFVDQLVVGDWVGNYEMHVPALICLSLSCAVAVLVNISQFMCLGRFSAVTFQVTGHAKTVLVLLGGYLYLGESIDSRKLLGMSLAVAGMIAYGYFSGRKKPSAPIVGLSSLVDRSPLIMRK